MRDFCIHCSACWNVSAFPNLLKQTDQIPRPCYLSSFSPFPKPQHQSSITNCSLSHTIQRSLAVFLGAALSFLAASYAWNCFPKHLQNVNALTHSPNPTWKTTFSRQLWHTRTNLNGISEQKTKLAGKKTEVHLVQTIEPAAAHQVLPGNPGVKVSSLSPLLSPQHQYFETQYP